MEDCNEKNKKLDIVDPGLRKADRHKKVSVANGPKLIMDMSWGSYMNEHNQKKVIQQLSISYAFNKKAEKSLPFIFTSVDLTWQQLFHRVNAYQWNKSIVRFEKNSLIDINIPLTDMVYLTADTDNVCTSLDPSKYYIIGCLLDHNSNKGVTHDFAVKHNIKMERLPIPEFITMEGRHVLTINHVAEILIRVANGIDWSDALIQTIPQRKFPKKKECLKPNDKINDDKNEEKQSFWNICNIS